MPSPFPGMNPYLERPDIWANVHNTFVHEIRRRLVAELRSRFFVSLEFHIYIHELPDEPPQLFGRPDVLISRPLGPVVSGGTATIEAPVRTRIPMPVDKVRVPYVAIMDRNDKETITVIELLSPSNKMNGPDREQYLSKRRSILYSSTNLVEIDLLRRGPKLPAEEFPVCDYSVLISRGDTRPDAAIWPINLREPLPKIPIPLRSGESNSQVDLQECLHEVYDVAGFETIAYEYPPEPALAPADAIWAKKLLEAAGIPS